MNVAKMVMCGDDPIRKAFMLAIEYINNDEIEYMNNDELMEESVDGVTDLFRHRVECLRDQMQIVSDSESDLD